MAATAVTVEDVCELLDRYDWDTKEAVMRASDPEDAESVAEAALRDMDQRLAPGSETSLLGWLVDDFRRKPFTLDLVEWWIRAYEAYDNSEEAYELLTDGDLDGAEARLGIERQA